jgi:hypothetical protein
VATMRSRYTAISSYSKATPSAQTHPGLLDGLHCCIVCVLNWPGAAWRHTHQTTSVPHPLQTSMEWYENTRQNQAMYAVDFAEIFIHTIGKTIGKVTAPGCPPPGRQRSVVTACQPTPGQLQLRLTSPFDPFDCSCCPRSPTWTARPPTAWCPRIPGSSAGAGPRTPAME